jgi:hypothetical protein
MKSVARLALFILFLTLPIHAHAQGCDQCRESVGQTSASTQQAYRRGILVLIIATTTVFAAVGIVMRRFR